MKRRYQVRYYEYGLTMECRRNFFTKFAAVIRLLRPESSSDKSADT